MISARNSAVMADVTASSGAVQMAGLIETRPDIVNSPAAEDLRKRFPGKRLFVRRRGMNREATEKFYQRTYAVGQSVTVSRNVPNVVVVNEWDGSVFTETNAFGMFGQSVDRSKRLVAIWGDSVVAGYGAGWIDTTPDSIPGFQVLNGGLGGTLLDHYVEWAISINRRLPIEYNVVFPGWNTMIMGVDSPQHFADTMIKAIEGLPNVILVMAPTSLNEHVLQMHPSEYEATAEELGFRYGYSISYPNMDPQEWAKKVYDLAGEQRCVTRQIVETYRQRGREIPVIDFYNRFRTDAKSEFREDFIDAIHFRVERYPKAWTFLSEQLQRIINS